MIRDQIVEKCASKSLSEKKGIGKGFCNAHGALHNRYKNSLMGGRVF